VDTDLIGVSANQDFTLRNLPGRAAAGPGLLVSNAVRSFDIDGPVEPERLHRAVNAVVARHESLRTGFVQRDGDWHGLVHIDPPTVFLAVADLTVLPPEQARAEADRHVALIADEPFAPDAPSQIRVGLITVTPRAHRLVIATSHLISDFYSLQVVVSELSAVYNGHEAGLSEPVPFSHYLQQHQKALANGGFDDTIAFWREKLRTTGVMPSLPLKIDKAPGTDLPDATAGSARVEFPPGLDRRLDEFITGGGATFFTAMLTATTTALHPHVDGDDLSLLLPVAGRPRGTDDALIGWLAHSVVCTLHLDGDPALADVVDQARTTARDILAHQGLSHHYLKHVLTPEEGGRPRSRFGVKFNVLANPAPLLLGEATGVDFIAEQARVPKNELVIAAVRHPDNPFLLAYYENERFDHADITDLLTRAVTNLAALIAEPGRRLSALR